MSPPLPPHVRTPFQVIVEQARRDAEAPIAFGNGRIVSYGELETTARRIAVALARRGLKRGDRIALLINNSAEWLEAFFGANALGVTVVPLSTWSTQEELRFLLHDSRPSALLTVPGVGTQNFRHSLSALLPESIDEQGWRSERFPWLRTIVFIGPNAPAGWIPYDALLAEAADDQVLPHGGAGSLGDDAVVLYTSGSTSIKAVRLVNSAVVENGFNIGERQRLTHTDRLLLVPPLFWSYGCANALPAVTTHGAALVLQPRFEPAEALDLIERHSCTALYTMPSITNALVRHADFSSARTRTLRTGLTIGGPEDVRLVANVLGARQICNVYGLTETYGNCCVTDSDASLDDRANGQGFPLPGFSIRIVDPDQRRPLPPGSTGEVEVGGYVTPGYSGASQVQNENLFTADGFLRTGDVGFLDSRGAFHFVSRGSEMIKRAGINTSPVEIENVLQQHPGVAQAAVVGVPDADRGELIMAFVVPKASTILAVEDLRSHCRALISSYKVPDRIELVTALPLTPTGKVLRRELKKLVPSLIENSSVRG